MEEWYEDLPEKCPPEDAIRPNNQKFYRLCDSPPPQNVDFFSHRKLFPFKPFNTTECIAQSLSIWESKEKCLSLKKLPAHKKKSVIEFKLSHSDGLILKTGQVFHYSWWRSKSFDISRCEIL